MPEAAIAEAPVTPPAVHPGAVTLDLSNLGKKPQSAAVVPPVTPAEPDKPAEAKDEKPPEIPPVVPPAKPNDKEHNMAELRKSREAAEARAKAVEEERDKLRAEFEAFKTQAPELPEDVKTRLTKAEQLEKELQEQRSTIRQLDLSRDPEFQAKYNQPITDRIGVMGKTALAAGVSEADWKNAVANWNEDQFAEWSESMTPIQRVKFTAAWTGAVDLYQQQQQELKNADQAYQELQKKRQTDAEAQQKQYFASNEQLARSVMSEILTPDALKEYEDLGGAAEALLLKAARHEIPAKEIFHQLAANQVLSRVTLKQKTRIEELEKQLAEREVKLKEQEEFISNQAGAVPRGDAAGASGAVGNTKPIWQNIVVKTPG
jgi:hypothetical protein